MSSLVTSALILATALLLAPLFKNLPNAVLGAIVITAVLGLIDVGEIRRYWAWRRTDFLLAMAAMVGVLLTTVLIGMLIAVALSIAFVLYRASRPHIAALGRMPGHGRPTRTWDGTPTPIPCPACSSSAWTRRSTSSTPTWPGRRSRAWSRPGARTCTGC